AAGVGLPAARAQVRRLLEEALPRSARRYPAPGGALDREILECIADLATDHAKRWFPEKVVEIEARHEAGLPGTPYGIMIRWIEGRRARRALVLWAPDTTSLRRSIPRLIALLAAEMDGE
ncbi:MAG: hypothetical protein HUU06_13945, partial [Planctomycetaceae bacterium]|nr:hypothetical protein [Planctomycetaceae bacterium]